MSYVFLTSRSITYAQRMQRALLKYGVSARIERPDMKLTQKSCAYAVVVSEAYLAEAIDILKKNGLRPVSAFVSNGIVGFREISI